MNETSYAALFNALAHYYQQSRILLGFMRDDMPPAPKVRSKHPIPLENAPMPSMDACRALERLWDAWRGNYGFVEQAIRALADAIDDEHVTPPERFTVRLHAALVRSAIFFINPPAGPSDHKFRVLVYWSHDAERLRKFQAGIDDIEQYVSILHVLKSGDADPGVLILPTPALTADAVTIRILVQAKPGKLKGPHLQKAINKGERQTYRYIKESGVKRLKGKQGYYPPKP